MTTSKNNSNTPPDAEMVGSGGDLDIKQSTAELMEFAGINSLAQLYQDISSAFDYYVDAPQETKNLIVLWILGTHYHKHFPTFPILYLNAMRGSGKTRTLNFISHLSSGFKGNVQNSISESALFHSNNSCLCIDEIEPRATEKTRLNLLLNSCYKRGSLVSRMIKTKKENTESYEKQEHSLYMPVALANIFGLDSVLENRCLIIFLERSFNELITRRTEDFDVRLADLKARLKTLNNDTMTQMTDMTQIIQGWNAFLDAQGSIITPSRASQVSQVSLIYQKIYESGISGRNLELCFPLLIIASFVSPDIFDFSLNHFTNLSKRKSDSELDEIHIMLYRFVATLQASLDEWYTSARLLERFKTFCGFEVSMNPTQLSLALDRLQLIKSRKRTANDRLISLDFQKAIQRTALFEGAK